MKINTLGSVGNGLKVLGLVGVPVYLLDIERPVLFEAGISCLTRIYTEAIREVLGQRLPETLFLSHLHFDHCGTAAGLKAAFPGLKVAASEKGASIIIRPNAIRLIRELSQAAADTVSQADPALLTDEEFQPFEVDLVLHDGQVLGLSDGLTMEILATPGHTWDFLSYYIPERKILMASEAVGCAAPNGKVMPECLVDYDVYLESIRRMAQLDVEILCQGHNWVFTGEDVPAHFQASIEAAEEFKSLVQEIWGQEKGDPERVMAKIKVMEYDPIPRPKQPEPAYLINLQARTMAVARSAGLVEGE